MSGTPMVHDTPLQDGHYWQAHGQITLGCDQCQARSAVTPVVRWADTRWLLIWECPECTAASQGELSEAQFAEWQATVAPWSLALDRPGADTATVGQ